MARAEEDTLTEAATLGHLGKMYRFTGQLQEARQALEHGLRIHLEMGHRHGAVAARLALGTVSADCGAWGPARSHLTRALAEAVDTDNYLAEVEALLELSWVERSIGDLDAALAVSTRAVERARSGAKPQALARALGHLASLFGPRGDAGAEAMSAEGIGLLRAHGPPAMLGHWLVWRARLPGLPLVEAAALLDEGAPLVRAEGRPDRLVQLCVALAHVAVRAGDGAAARRWLEVARGHVPDGHVRAQLEIQRAEAGRVD